MNLCPTAATPNQALQRTAPAVAELEFVRRCYACPMNGAEKTVPIAACPKCRATDGVGLKLIASHFAIPSDYGFFEPYEVNDETRFHASPFTRDGYFISALHCSACGIDIIPDAILPDLGIQKRTSRASISENLSPFSVGYPKTDPS